MHSPSKLLILTVLATLGLGAGPAFAQAPATQQPPPPQRVTSSSHEGFGIQLGGGPVFANLTDAQGFNTSNKTGWLVGLLMGGNRGGTVGVEADVLYGQKGAKIGQTDFDQHVVDVPVMLKINGGSSNVNGVSVFGVGGGFFDWQFNSKLGSVDISDDTDGYEVGWVIGAGVEALRFSIQGRFQRGVKSIGRNFDVANAQDSHSKAFVVLFAFRLN
jgi:outer membrane protein with beta-barrel domain